MSKEEELYLYFTTQVRHAIEGPANLHVCEVKVSAEDDDGRTLEIGNLVAHRMMCVWEPEALLPVEGEMFWSDYLWTFDDISDDAGKCLSALKESPERLAEVLPVLEYGGPSSLLYLQSAEVDERFRGHDLALDMMEELHDVFLEGCQLAFLRAQPLSDPNAKHMAASQGNREKAWNAGGETLSRYYAKREGLGLKRFVAGDDTRLMVGLWDAMDMIRNGDFQTIMVPSDIWASKVAAPAYGKADRDT